MNTTLLAVGLMLVSAFSHALFNAMTKRAADKALFRAIFLGAAGCMFLPLTLFVAFPSREVWGHLALSLVIHGSYFYTTIAALERADMGVVYPIMRGLAPAISALVALVFLGERLGLVPAAALVGICAILIAFAWPGRAAPVDRSALVYAVASAILIAGYSVNDAAGTRAAASPWAYIVWFFVSVSLPISVTVIASARARLKGDFPHAFRREARVALPTSLIGITSFGAALYAFSLAPVAPLVALRETSVVFGALLAALFLKEPFGQRRLVLAVLLTICLVTLQSVI